MTQEQDIEKLKEVVEAIAEPINDIVTDLIQSSEHKANSAYRVALISAAINILTMSETRRDLPNVEVAASKFLIKQFNCD